MNPSQDSQMPDLSLMRNTFRGPEPFGELLADLERQVYGIGKATAHQKASMAAYIMDNTTSPNVPFRFKDSF